MGNGAGAGSRDDERESEGHDVGYDPPAAVAACGRFWLLTPCAVKSYCLRMNKSVLIFRAQRSEVNFEISRVQGHSPFCADGARPNNNVFSSIGGK